VSPDTCGAILLAIAVPPEVAEPVLAETVGGLVLATEGFCVSNDLNTDGSAPPIIGGVVAIIMVLFIVILLFIII
jgi:hypothetical protein